MKQKVIKLQVIFLCNVIANMISIKPNLIVFFFVEFGKLKFVANVSFKSTVARSVINVSICSSY